MGCMRCRMNVVRIKTKMNSARLYDYDELRSWATVQVRTAHQTIIKRSFIQCWKVNDVKWITHRKICHFSKSWWNASIEAKSYGELCLIFVESFSISNHPSFFCCYKCLAIKICHAQSFLRFRFSLFFFGVLVFDFREDTT